MFGLVILLGSALLGNGPDRFSNIVPGLTQMHPFSLYGKERDRQDLPGTLRDTDQVFSSTLTVPSRVRLPFGPNPQEHHIAAFDMIDNEYYARRYQQNIHLMRVSEPDWRLDVFDNSSMNNYANYHSSEAPYRNILNFQRPKQQPIQPGLSFD